MQPRTTGHTNDRPRPARQAELPAIEAVWAASQDADEPLGRAPGGWWSITRWATMTRVMRAAGRTIGVAAVEYRSTADAAEARVALLPRYRDGHHGAQLVRASVELAHQAGAPTVRLYTPRAATWATNPARALRFRPVRSQHLMLRPADAPALSVRPHPELLVRPLRNGEEGALLAALNRAWAGTWNARPITLATLLADLRGHNAGFLVAVTRDEQQIVATSHAIFDATQQNPDGGPYAWVANLTTDPDWRGHGLGRSMLAAALDVLRQRGAGSVALGADGGAAIPFGLYQTSGFNPISSVDIWERATNLERWDASSRRHKRIVMSLRQHQYSVV